MRKKVDRRVREKDEGRFQRVGRALIRRLRRHLLPEGEGRAAAGADACRSPRCPARAPVLTLWKAARADIPARKSAGAMRRMSVRRAARGLCLRNWVWVAHGSHAPGWRGSRAARTSPDDVRIRQAAALPLNSARTRPQAQVRGARPTRIPPSIRRPDPPQARPAVPTLIPPVGEARRRGRIRWLAWPSPRDRLPAEPAGLRLLPGPAARYDGAGRPSSRPDRTV